MSSDPLSDALTDAFDADPKPGATPPEEAPPSAPPEEAAPEAATPEERLYAGRFRDPESMEAAYTALEARMGQQGNELGQLRQALQEGVQQQQDLMAGEEFDGLADDDAQQAAFYAAEHFGRGDPRYERALSDWAIDDPLTATRFDTELRLLQERELIGQQFGSALGPLQQNHATQTMVSAFEDVKGGHPDFGDYEQAMLEVAQSRPRVLADLERGDPETIRQTIEDLYFIAKSRQSPAAGMPAPAVSDGQRIAATVASGTAGAGSATAPRPRTTKDAFYAMFDAELANPRG